MKAKIKDLYLKNPDLVHLLSIVTVGLVVGLIIGSIYYSGKDLKPPVPNHTEKISIAPLDTGKFGDVIVHNSDEGEIVIGSDYTAVPLSIISDPNKIWEEEQYTGNFTTPKQAELKDGSLGVLTIDRIGLSTNVYQSPNDMETLGHNVAHFPSTSAWDGNIGLSAHNVNLDGSNGLFLNLHQLKEGDVIRYKTALGDRTYSVSTIKTIPQSDWSLLGHSDTNQITLLTCITGQPSNRLVVQAVEIAK